MSEQQEIKAQEIINRIEKKERILNRLFWVLIISIITMIGSVSALTNSSIQTKKDIEYVRENAVNKKAVEKLIETINVKNESVQKLIENENIKIAIKYFDDKMARIMDDIISWNSEIIPRGTKIEFHK